MPLEIPKRKEVVFNEVRGEYREVEIEDRPYRLIRNQFIERKGSYEDVKEFLTDYEVLEAGGLQAFFNSDGSRKKGAWPYDPKAVVKKKTKKKAAKKK